MFDPAHDAISLAIKYACDYPAWGRDVHDELKVPGVMVLLLFLSLSILFIRVEARIADSFLGTTWTQVRFYLLSGNEGHLL